MPRFKKAGNASTGKVKTDEGNASSVSSMSVKTILSVYNSLKRHTYLSPRDDKPHELTESVYIGINDKRYTGAHGYSVKQIGEYILKELSKEGEK